jgi:hypothetical protein
MNNEKIIKMIYAALEVKHVAFTMYKKDNSTFFIFDGEIIEICNEIIYHNAKRLDDINDAIKAIKK